RTTFVRHRRGDLATFPRESVALALLRGVVGFLFVPHATPKGFWRPGRARPAPVVPAPGRPRDPADRQRVGRARPVPTSRSRSSTASSICAPHITEDLNVATRARPGPAHRGA